jgi:chromosome segregation ATPase
MSDERFDRLENQLSQVIQAIGTMQQNMATMQQSIGTMQQEITAVNQKVSVIEQKVSVVEQKVTALGNNLDAVREDVNSLRRRVESNEGTVLVAIRDGFRAQEDSINDLNYDLSVNERKTRRLSRRVARLERKDSDD